MVTNDTSYSPETGRPIDESYLEADLPSDLAQALEDMKRSWEKVEAGEYDPEWGDCHSELIAIINSCAVEGEITQRQADYLRSNYV